MRRNNKKACLTPYNFAFKANCIIFAGKSGCAGGFL